MLQCESEGEGSMKKDPWHEYLHGMVMLLMEMRNIQEKSVCMCAFWIGTHRHLFCSHVQKPPKNIQYYAPNLVPNPTLRPISWQILPSKKMTTLFFRVLHESPLLNPIFDPSAKSVSFFFRIYPVYNYFSSSSWLSLSSKPLFWGEYRHTLDILWVWFQILLTEDRNKVSQSFCWWRVLPSICKNHNTYEVQ